jgi:hypothetical protein
MPDNAIFNSSIAWDFSLFHDEPVTETSATAFEETVQQWAERELSMGADGADIHKATHALLHGGSVIDLAGLHLTSLPDITLPPGVLRLDLSDNPRLTTLPARFLDQSPYICVVIDNTSLCSEDIRFFEDSLGSKLFHYEQQPTDGAELQARCSYSELFITGVEDDTVYEYANPLSGVASDPAAGDDTVDMAHERAEYEQVYASPVHSGADVDSYASSVPPDETRSPASMEQDLPSPEHRAWLKTHVDDKRPAGKMKMITLGKLLENAKPFPEDLSLGIVAKYYGIELSSVYSAIREARRPKANGRVSVRGLSVANQAWLERNLSGPVARSERKMKTLASLIVAQKSLPVGLTEKLIAQYYNVNRSTLHSAIFRAQTPQMRPPLSEDKRAWFASHWDNNVPAGVEKKEAVAALYLSQNTFPLGITCRDIAEYYNLKFTTFEHTIKKLRSKAVQPPLSDTTLAWLEQNWNITLANITYGKIKRLAVLYLADNTRPAELTKRQIAGYYKIDYYAFTTTIWNEKKNKGPATAKD